MIRRTPFHPRLEQLNESGLWGHWAGHLAAPQYDLSVKQEYVTVRTAAGFFDTSPLHKYLIRGRDAEKFCSYAFARDPRGCPPGRAQYTLWCDDEGMVMEDGVLFRLASDEFLLTAGQPNYGYLSELAADVDIDLVDCSDDLASLAIQGPRSRMILGHLIDDLPMLRYFDVTATSIAGVPVTVSRTGFSGDLGYELLIPTSGALDVLDALLEVGQPLGLRPYGDIALDMTRIEAGLPLFGREFTSSRYAFVAEDRFTPTELGLGWLLTGITDDTRPFIGRQALLREMNRRAPRWQTVGITVAWADYYELFTSHGLLAVPREIPLTWESMIYTSSGQRVGYATSFMYSPLLQKHIGIARVRPGSAEPGSRLFIEQTVTHEYLNVAATVTALPFYSPERKTAM